LMAVILACAASRYRPKGRETGGLMAHGIPDGLRQTGWAARRFARKSSMNLVGICFLRAGTWPAVLTYGPRT
jgi:hypothetical protein